MSTPDSRIAASLWTAQAAAATVSLVGAGVLLGWAFGIASLKHVVPGLVSMVPNTALCLCLLGAVVFQRARAAVPPTLYAAGQAIALLVAVVSGLTLLQYLSHQDFGIDQFLFLDDTRVMPAEYPGRMAPVTAICLLLSSFSLLLGRWTHVPCVLAVWVLLFGVLAVTGYAFGVSSLYQVIGYTSVALHTAVALVLLSVAMLASRPRQGMLPIILSRSAGGDVARRLLWMVPLLLLWLDWLVLQGEKAQWYDSRFGYAVSAVSAMAASTAVILLVAYKLHLADRQRQQALVQLAELNSQLEAKVADRTQALTLANEQLAQEIAERKQAEERVHRLSLTDELTGLLNRRGFFLLAEQALKTARRVRNELTLIYIDLDGLKRTNDERGHQAGDTMIVETAQLLKASFRESDLVARLGGDEFAVLAVSGDTPESMLQRLQRALGRFNKDGVLPDPLSFSVGSVGCRPQDELSLMELLAEADARMYLQKQEHKQASTLPNAGA
ncbi:GGDEF domain-containing protein [Aquabacterium sp. A08]|uniref:GGDEF domain-containing protein n=1 Tax=Aquabacterium sp. A08 TaxID=2718532 RepID=UPI001421C901|nr:GGDEF domain-containing protein [Aquabacterium sp. A08]NIC43679.1 diguanylate cyclase [Aquabacterium sp. A08]